MEKAGSNSQYYMMTVLMETIGLNYYIKQYVASLKMLFCCFSLFLIFTHEACECSHLGNNCDPHTGRCICPPNTIGERCDKCAPNHWGHDIISGCKVS